MKWIDLLTWVVPMYILYYGTIIIIDLVKGKKTVVDKNLADVYEMDSDDDTTDVSSLFKESKSNESNDSMLSIDSSISEIDVIADEVKTNDEDFILDVESLKYQSIPVKEYVSKAKRLTASVDF